YRAGRQSEALDVYRSFRGLLSDELGLEPSHELRELEAAILRQDDTLAAPVPTKPTIEPAPTSHAPPAPSGVAHGRRRTAAAIAAVVVVVAGGIVAALALSGGSSARRALTVPPLSAAAIDPSTGQVVKVVPLDGTPDAALAVGSTVWVASWANSTLTRIDDR